MSNRYNAPARILAIFPCFRIFLRDFFVDSALRRRTLALDLFLALRPLCVGELRRAISRQRFYLSRCRLVIFSSSTNSLGGVGNRLFACIWSQALFGCFKYGSGSNCSALCNNWRWINSLLISLSVFWKGLRWIEKVSIGISIVLCILLYENNYWIT